VAFEVHCVHIIVDIVGFLVHRIQLLLSSSDVSGVSVCEEETDVPAGIALSEIDVVASLFLQVYEGAEPQS